MKDRISDAVELSERVTQACRTHNDRMLDLYRSASAAANARDLQAARHAYHQAQEALAIARETTAQVLGAIKDFVAGGRREG
ncbi:MULTISPECIES: hypothetical protein [Methylobacterium]|jgi:soluble cytochrome b562|uniref:Phasin domain-containing protein n=1 Tax=Methylobacterium isbiliense TaxID=315478 RepID=A0ABQ4SNV8_9HYPH|nr:MULTISPECIES: hypothetical protein [Methylobacterium]MBY0299403.1 hypothetical protein [Methylobacterium sp.]MDN3627844.1 hypothetical protein [Methylobacterium isbiliense]GJE03366.1 hypothetical protein GMJLKIPL_5320 [Methylobacterium isbiliense]